MRIVIDARNINTSTGRYAERLIHYLEELDTTNEYIVLVLQKDINFYKPQNPNFSVRGVKYPWFSLSEQLGMARYLYSLKADLVHFTMMHHPIFYFRPYVTTFHDLTLLKTYNSDKNYVVYKVKQFIGRFVYQAMAHWSTHLITPTKFGRNELVAFSHIDPSKVTVTYEGGETTAQKARSYRELRDKNYLLYVGQQSDYKNIRRLMQAHQQLRRTHSDLLLVLVGRLSGKNGKPLQTNRQWAKEQGFKGIIYTDFVPDDQLVWLFQHCSVYVFPSLMEGFGLPGLEAMGYGAPVASSNATCLPEIYKDAALYFDPCNVDKMTSVIGQILDSKKLQEELRVKGAKVNAQYSWKRMAAQTLKVYKTIFKQK
ncbi:MAG TPA: glycosyltransferase family 1 protein [Candidatus Saccharimonadales bacterium]|nr:glycosyltransferase family 1 protein [Candidatus Saccharimonadales bacterium]